MMRRSFAIGLAALMALLFNASPATATPIPTGERSFHNGGVEAVYDAAHEGRIGYFYEPGTAPTNAPPVAWAPIYVVVYPTGSTAASTYLCMHVPVENCPSHGNAIAAAAQSIVSGVYGGGVAGHDHVMDLPSGDDFNFAWEPVVVLFTSSAAANQHLLTDDAILAAQQRGDVILVPISDATFNCAVVSSRVWDMATPVV
jgi:hypothetical protein